MFCMIKIKLLKKEIKYESKNKKNLLNQNNDTIIEIKKLWLCMRFDNSSFLSEIYKLMTEFYHLKLFMYFLGENELPYLSYTEKFIVQFR